MGFAPYVHSVIPNADERAWPIQPQGINECGCTAPANALNLLLGQRRFDKDEFVRQAGLLFRRKLGGTPSPVTGWLIKRNGFGTHFGTLRQTDREAVLRDLIDRGVPVIVELGAFKVGPLTLYGQHSVVMVGYSDRYTDAAGQSHEEYYFVDAQYPALSDGFGPETNNVDRNGDGVAESFPGNRTISRALFLADYPTGIYFPVFRTQAAHDEWYRANMRPQRSLPVLGTMLAGVLTGQVDIWQPS